MIDKIGIKLTTVFSLLMFFTISPVSSKERLVNSPESYKEALTNSKPGDSIILKNGIWNDFEILFKANGSKAKPITLTAQKKGKVILTGQSNLRIAGKHLIVSGLVFKNGFTPSSEVIAFRRNKVDLAYHSRVTEVVIDNYSNPDRFESDYWVGMYGQYNRFDHNHLVGKRNKGVTLAVRLNSNNSQNNHHKIDHNYFGPRPVFGSNGGETLRIGTSHYSMTDSHTTVSDNFFDRCNGEVEIISVKSGKNQIKNNTFYESRGTLTLRHGNGNLIEGNVFFGNGVDHTGGVRIINRDQTVKNNYFEGLTGYRFGSGFTIMNGVPDSPINRYHQVVNAKVENNTFVDVDHIHLAAGSDQERSAVPKNSSFKNNLFFNNNGQSPFSVFDDISGIKFRDNISNQLKESKINTGINAQKVTLKRAGNGLLYPDDKELRFFGASVNLRPTSKNETGTTWYEKEEPEVEFGSGQTISVSASGDELINAVVSAKPGDVLILDDGQFDLRKIVKLNKTISIKSKNRQKSTISFDRSTLFEIADGGSLQLDGLVINGANSPDSSGNTLARTSKWGMTKNYRFEVKNSLIENLVINHSFHFFDSGSRAFASYILIENNRFKNITGDLFRLDKESDDLGIYNAEYVTLKNNEFINVEGSLVNLYRGGSDESTFGPHLYFQGNKVVNASLGKRNKSKASIWLHGVQVTNVKKNMFDDSQIIKVEHTVGEPVTNITDNQFKNTEFPGVVELRVRGPHTANLKNNKKL
ncbi:MAG: polysaccharide lyase 6 family protein [Kangiellaceae bacterium]|nr:polysaccharide lyase 6 family protein [Kangiellaceae bacterium]